MPRFFFHVDNGEFITDPQGIELAHLQEAQAEAVRISGQMINDLDGQFWKSSAPWDMHVCDDHNRLLFTLQFSAKMTSGEVTFIPPIQS